MKNVAEVSGEIIGGAIEVHKALGPGALESAYEICLMHELTLRRLRLERQKALPLNYRGVHLDLGYRIDLVVEDLVIVELKAVEHVLRVHESQLYSYLKLSGCRVGLLINFHVPKLTDGIRRWVHQPFR